MSQKRYCVFATLRNTPKVGSLRGLSDAKILELNVTSKDSITRCAEKSSGRTSSTLDLQINNAGCDTLILLLDSEIDEMKEFFDIYVVLSNAYIGQFPAHNVHAGQYGLLLG
ncbi:hypothetical protein F4823DRAFT_568663 [Ustulina deusta]|nr:hypothetical protein F4823DRAFT_568663 [Ustulina deusta]